MDIGDRELVLVVEDEAAVRAFCCTVLRRSGYRVIEAPGPAEALDALASCRRGCISC